MAAEPEIIAQVVKHVEVSAKEMSASAHQIEVVDDGGYEAAGQLMLMIRQRSKELETARKETTDPIRIGAKKAIEKVMGLFNPPQEMLTAAEDTLNDKMITFKQEKARQAAEAEARLRRAAIDEEAKQKAKIERQADKLEEKGREDAAEERRTEAARVHVPRPVIPAAPPKVKGLTTRTRWHFRIINADLIPRKHLIPNEKSLQGEVDNFQDKTDIPGIEVWSTEKVGGAGGRK